MAVLYTTSSVQLNLYKNDNVCNPGEGITGTVECFVNSVKTSSSNCLVALKGKSTTELSPGNYSYAFGFMLPPGCLPSSYDGIYGHILFNMSLSVTGFVPGQDINVDAYIQNLTRLSVEKMQLKIVLATVTLPNCHNLENEIALVIIGGIPLVGVSTSFSGGPSPTTSRQQTEEPTVSRNQRHSK
ncbi:hypothetical protein ILUMI_11364, partial [Ignelater luminosus]